MSPLGAAAADRPGPMSLLLEAREVPLGGVRGMQVYRALPQRDLPMVGAWCFLDRFGPQRTRMRVEPHPHIGLQTVTWPLIGDVHHRDSIGSDVVVTRGALNLMTSGAGISHSEYSLADEHGNEDVELDALQLWVALPGASRHMAPAFERHEALPGYSAPGLAALVVMGSFAGVTSPASTHTPIVGAELRLAPGVTVRLPLDRDWEYAFFGVQGSVMIGTTATAPVTLESGSLLFVGDDREHIEVRSEGGATLFLLGGEPFDEEIVMWWNFVARTHDEIVEAREDWEHSAPRFGHVTGHGAKRIPAPPLPGVHLKPRQRRLG